MSKFEDWLNGVPLAGLMTVSFFTGGLYVKVFSGLEWETLVAGFLGLSGGFLAYTGVRSQHTSHLLSNALFFKLQHYDAVVKAQKITFELSNELARNHEPFFEKESENKSSFDELTNALSSAKDLPSKMFDISSEIAQLVIKWKETWERFSPDPDPDPEKIASVEDFQNCLKNLALSIDKLQKYLSALKT